MTCRKLAASLIPLAALFASLAAMPLSAPEGIHEKYVVAPGELKLLIPNPTGSGLGDVQFAFNGSATALRIRQVRTNCRGVDVTFADATPHDATAYFNGAPFSTDANYFEITIENVDDKPASLQFKMSFVRGGTSPCGL